MRVFLCEDIEFVTTQFNIDEVTEYLEVMADKYGLSEKILQSQLKLLPLTVYDRAHYDDHIEKAAEKMAEKDPDDVELLALALKMKIPVWTNDKHFSQAGVETYSTAQLLKSFKL
ncbi:MAG: PIN domain-containing protein [Pseudomonadota bacterium]